MKNRWIVFKEGPFLALFLKRVSSYRKNIFDFTIIREEAHKYCYESNAVKASLASGCKVEKIVENKSN